MYAIVRVIVISLGLSAPWTYSTLVNSYVFHVYTTKRLKTPFSRLRSLQALSDSETHSKPLTPIINDHDSTKIFPVYFSPLTTNSNSNKTTTSNGDIFPHIQTKITNTPASQMQISKQTQTDSKVTVLSATSTINRPVLAKQQQQKLLPGSLTLQKLLAKPQVEIIDCSLVLLSTFLVALYTLPSLPPPVLALDTSLEDIITYLFAIQFLLRWYGIGQLSGQYLLKPFSLIDLLVVIFPLICSKGFIPSSILPLWLSSNSGLSTLLLLRILRLQRVLTDMDTFTQFELSLGLNASDIRPYQLQLARVLLSVFTLLSVSTGLIYSAEHVVNPNIPDFFTALYFGLTTLTTVGFGDITPVTFQGRLVVCASILVGVAILPAQTAGLVEALLDFQKEREEKRKMKPMESNTLNKQRKDYVMKQTVEGTVGEGFVLLQVDDDVVDDEHSTSLSNNALSVCMICNASPHRADAIFCWNCGSKL